MIRLRLRAMPSELRPTLPATIAAAGLVGDGSGRGRVQARTAQRPATQPDTARAPEPASQGNGMTAIAKRLGAGPEKLGYRSNAPRGTYLDLVV